MSMKQLMAVGAMLIGVAAVSFAPASAQDATEAATERPPVVTPTITQGEQLLHETFSTSDSWEKYSSGDGVEFGVIAGAYSMFVPKTSSGSLIWGVNTLEQTDESIAATFIQSADNPNAHFGLMCRTNTDGVGYYFIVGGDGIAYIGKGDDNQVIALTDPVASAAINQGTDANTVRAVCVGNYLALYANDQLVAEANDDEYTSGVSGLAASTTSNTADTDVTVDDLDIYAVTASYGPAIAPPVVEDVTVGKVLLAQGFDTPDAWENFDDNERKEHLYVSDGVYTISTGGDLYIWGQNKEVVGNGVITVEASLEDGPETSGYGVICRASEDNKGSGYYLLIAGDGYYGIMRSDPDVEKFIPLVSWTESSAINKGVATNTITAVCVDDYLAIYANGTKLGETHDSTYAQGVTGLTAASGQPGIVNINFDNLAIFNAKVG